MIRTVLRRAVAIVSLIGWATIIQASTSEVQAATSSGKDVTYSTVFGGQKRVYIVHIPPNYTATQSYPIMIVYHGSGGTGAGIETKTEFDSVADANAFFVAYPYGVDGNWVPIGSNNDVQFTEYMLQQIEKLYSINTGRIYASGFSEGGGMVQYLACGMVPSLAGFADVAANLSQGIINNCQGTGPVPALFFHGTADPVIGYDGGGNCNGVCYSAEQTAQWWAGKDGCPGAGASTQFPDTLNDGSQVTDTEQAWSNCAVGTFVSFYTIQNGGHTWPGGINTNKELGLYSLDLIASKVIWQSLSAFTR